MNTFTIRVLNKLGLMEGLNVCGQKVVNGRTFKIPVLGKVGIPNLFVSEAWMTQLLQIVLQEKSGTFLDVGANIGQTLLKVKSIADQITYVGFEPNAVCNFYLQQLIQTNKIQKALIIPVGVASENGLAELTFYHSSQTDSSASIVKDFRSKNKVHRKEYAPTLNFETFNSSLNLADITVLKIDVEGAELEVLTSFQKVIEKYNPIVIIEILPVYKQENTRRLERQKQVEELMHQLDYVICSVEKNKTTLLGLKSIETIGVHRDLNRCEYVLVPKKGVKGLEERIVNGGYDFA